MLSRLFVELDKLPDKAYRLAAPELILLKTLRHSGLPVASSVVSTRSLYRQFQRHGEIPHDLFQSAVYPTVRQLAGQLPRVLARNASWEKDSHTFQLDSIELHVNPTAIRTGLHALFRRWQSDQSLAYRLTHNAPRNLFPVLVISATNGAVRECHSRHPSSGARTDSANFDGTLVNSVSRLTQRLARSLHLSELKAGAPVTLHVCERREDIIAAHEEVMLDDAKLVSLLELWQSRKLTTAATLDRVAALPLVHGREALAASPSFSIRGLPASGGVGAGPLILRGETPAAPVVGAVFMVHESVPDDIGAMWRSSAVVTLTGGVTSHAAVLCRSMEKPCVTGAVSLHIAKDQRRLVGPNGQTVPQGTFCVVNGFTGQVTIALGGLNSLVSRPVVSDLVMSHRGDLERLVASADASTGSLGGTTRDHIARLRRVLAELGDQ